MEYCVTTKKDDSWYIGTDHFDLFKDDKTEAIMFQGNGYLGIRATAEERNLNERRNMFVAGTFDAFNDEVTELPNLPDLLNMGIQINQQIFSLSMGLIENYHKHLNLKNGELIRSFDWLINGNRISFKFSRFVSMSDVHLLVSKLEISSDQSDLKITLNSGIDGQYSNSGTQHLVEGDKRLFEGKILQLQEKTQQSNIGLAFNVLQKAYINKEQLDVKPNIDMGRRQIFDEYNVDLNKGDKFTFVKYANVYTTIDKDIEHETISVASMDAIKKSSMMTYKELLDKSTNAWNINVWQRSLISIDSDDVDPQVAINFARYQLAANTPKDPRMNIAAKGLTGEGYKGHTFWDTEIYMLPYFTFTMPEMARNLLEYRYLGLDGARRKARDNDYWGAQFPWESAWSTDGEMTPPWGSADIVTGKPMRILSGSLEQHITSDVVIAVMQYLAITEDQKFAEDMGYEIILDAAKFWASRLDWDPEYHKFMIDDVIGPDEYKEHIDNNAFTNYTAFWCIQKAIAVVELLRNSNSEIYDRLNSKLHLDDAYQDWISKVDLIFLPKPNKSEVIPEDDSYLQKKIVDTNQYQSDGGHAKIFKDYNIQQINDLQVIKQADVLLLIFLFDDLFGDDIKLANWNYYEPKTTHDSSLSFSTHSILASDLNLADTAYEYFEKACEIDLGSGVGKSVQGLHMASIGGIWNMVVEGFGGVRVLDGQLRIEPHLPSKWNSLHFEINWHQSLLKIDVYKDTFQISVLGDAITFVNHNELYHVAANSKIVIPISVEVNVED